mmetsp:Transcript_2906/g.8505  ORF Transcript_2906/g.8505 Transcript_2906/m.8505 type:complete len:208 (+) Transcript_2906:1682-2305(+)
MPVATFSTKSPIKSGAILHEYSTTSRPRNTSPFPSARVLPCSNVTLAASASMFSRMRCCSFSMTRWRWDTGVLRQAGYALRAAATAASNSASVVCGTRDTTSWFAGFVTSIHSSVEESLKTPLISCFTVGAMLSDDVAGCAKAAKHRVRDRLTGLYPCTARLYDLLYLPSARRAAITPLSASALPQTCGARVNLRCLRNHPALIDHS